ncbi:hypothetical protein BGX28_005579 [Mortierella sp. GBA30]|nr:hypothetical protein BGX28_005579 [Mortierella sp. GBA30]
MADSTIPTPYNQFCFFKSLSFSLYEHDWYNFVEQWQAMVAVNAPIAEFSYNLLPFFSNARRILPVFHRYMGFAQRDPQFLNTLTTVLMSTPLLIKVQNILQSTALFTKYVTALQMDNASASHTQVMQSIQTFLSDLPAPTRLEVQRVFAEAEASDSMGLSSSTLETAHQLLHSDTQLYIDVLKTMQLNQTRNMPWDMVVSKIKTLMIAKKPYAWTGMDQFLKHLHWGYYQEQQQYDYYPDEGTEAFYGYGYEEYENDDITERIEGVDYHPDKHDEYELGTLTKQGDDPSSKEAKSTDVADTFAKMNVSDKRQVIQSC